MEQRAVYGCGTLHILDQLKDGPGIRVSRDFAEQLSYQFASLSRRFFDTTGDLPFAYRERQVSASILGAMNNFVDAVFAEIPTKRGGEKDQSHGWIDYWAIYRKTTFLLELKHSYSTIRSHEKVQAQVSDRWKAANNQLENLNRTHCEHHRFGIGEMIKVPFLITTHYVLSGSENNALLNIEIDEICNRHKILAKGLSPGPNWSSVFIVKEDMVGPYEYSHGWESYPAVSIFLNFETVRRPS